MNNTIASTVVNEMGRQLRIKPVGLEHLEPELVIEVQCDKGYMRGIDSAPAPSACKAEASLSPQVPDAVGIGDRHDGEMILLGEKPDFQFQ